MDQVISAADANRRFSHILRSIREDVSYIITAHGRPVARIVPAPANASADARRALLDRLESEPVAQIGRWTRDELYER